MTKVELERMYSRYKADLANSIEGMKMIGASLGKTIDDIQDDVMQTGELY